MQASTQQKIVYILILQWKQESAIKRESVLQYALSHQHWKKISMFPDGQLMMYEFLPNWDGFGAGCSVQLMGHRTVSLIMIQTLGIHNLRACQL
jgi:hypothetical protein